MDFTSFMQGAMLGGGNSGGGGGGSGHIGGIAISALTGVYPINNSVENGIGSLSASESQADYEGFNIALQNLTIGKSYTVNFDFQYTDAEWFVANYRSGVKIRDTNYSSYINWQDWSENLDRDLLKHNHQMTFTATATTMYVSFNVCALSDSRVNYFEITDFYVRETSQ